MWTSTGPSSKKPLDGDGIDAITRGIVPVAPDGGLKKHPVGAATALEQDLERELWGAAALEQLDRHVQIYVEAGRKPPGSASAVASPFQLLGPPVLDPFELCVLENVEFRLAHRVTSGIAAVIPKCSAFPAAIFSPDRVVQG
jgi:hypothetical protein